MAENLIVTAAPRGRILENVLRKWLFRGKVLVLTGARQVGKSTLTEQLIATAKVKALVLNGDLSPDRKLLRDTDLTKLKNVIGKNQLVIIDEIQRMENPGLLLKVLADNYKKIQIIATGSSSLDIADRVFEPLTGRHFLFHLYPFALKELYEQAPVHTIASELPFHLVFGLYPDVCNHRADAKMYLSQLAGQYLYKDVLAWRDIRKPDLLDRLLELIAWQVGQEVSLHEIGKQLGIKAETVESYIDVLEKAFVVFRLRSYSTNNRKEVSKLRKIYFWDNGIRNSIIGNFDPITHRDDAGALWENFMIAERVKMNHYLGKDFKSYFWRSLQKQEVDYVEAAKKKLKGFELKFSTLKRAYVTRAFTNLYPNAATALVTPDTFGEFCYLEV